MYNNELQNIDTPEKAYLLGLFYSDGNTSKSNKYNYSRVQLKGSDNKLLRDLQIIFPFFKIYIDKKTNKVTLQSNQKKVKLHLIENGCLPDKSFSNKEMLKLPNLNEELYPHFIRGYFDGDGGCTFTQKNIKIQKKVYIYSNNINIINSFSIILNKLDIKNTITNSNINRISILYKLEISTTSYKEFFNYLYKNSTICLERKHVLFKYIIENTNFFVKKDCPNCPRCNSKKVVSHGKCSYNQKRIYLCRNCKRTFTFAAPVNSDINRVEIQPIN